MTRARTTNFQNTPHPLLTSCTVYLVDVPDHIQWVLLEFILKRCGTVSPERRIPGKSGHSRWPVRFSQIHHAEMALATLQGVQIPGAFPPLRLVLSHAADPEQTGSQSTLYPQYIKFSDANKPHILRNTAAQEVFRWFRNAGPLASVKVAEDVGNTQKTCILQYYNEEHARFAQSKCNLIHSALKSTGEFSLRTFIPNCLMVSNLGPETKDAQVRARFGKFGNITAVRLMEQRRNCCRWHITFSSVDDAARALRETNGTPSGSAQARVYEPKEQSQFCAQGEAKTSSDSGLGESETGSTAGEAKSTPNSARNSGGQHSSEAETKSQSSQREEEQRARNEDEPRRHAEIKICELKVEEARKKKAAATQAVQEHLKKIHEVTSKRDVLTEARRANQDVNTLLEEGVAVQEALQAKTAEAHSTQAEVWADAFRAVQEAEKVLGEARQREKQELENMVRTERDRENAQKASEDAKRHLADSKLRGEKLHVQVSKIGREAKRVKEEGEALQRAQQLAEGIVKMTELSLEEEKDRLKDLRGKSLRDAEEARRRKEAVLAKQAEERKAREEQERRESETRRRRQVYEEAKARERKRCSERDNNFTSPSKVWSHAQAISRYKAVSIEFDALEFCEAQPLTFGSIPWPLLTAPKSTTLEQIEWDVVESFFEMLKRSTKKDEFKTLVQEAHRRFHPDRWRSRGLLDTVSDAEEREKLAAAGNIVAQALTPIWMKSRAK